MPFYDYECSGCDRQYILRHGVNEQGERVCPVCGSVLKKLISAFNISTYPVKSVKVNGEEVR